MIAKFTESSPTAITVAGVDIFTSPQYTDGRGTNARFLGPLGILFHPLTGNLLVADKGIGLRKIELPSGDVSTLVNYNTDDGFLPEQAVSNPLLLSVGLSIHRGTGDIYVIDLTNIWRVSSSRSLTLMAGPGSDTNGYADGQGTAVFFNQLYGVAVDSENGWVYVSDQLNSLVRRMDISSRQVITVAGRLSDRAVIDGYGTSAYFDYPSAMTIDQYGVVFLIEYGGAVRRKISHSLGASAYNVAAEKWSCLPGYESVGTSSCAPCSIGNYKSFTGIGACSQCPVGQESAEDRSECVSCAAGKYRPSLLIPVCIDCPPNSNCTSSSFVCNAGFILNSTSATCISCPANQESKPDRTACRPCRSGQYFSTAKKIACLALWIPLAPILRLYVTRVL